MLPISRSHLYSLALKGEVRLIKVGNRTLLPASELERLLSGGSAQ
jgi:excisionase family DNA binding protein